MKFIYHFLIFLSIAACSSTQGIVQEVDLIEEPTVSGADTMEMNVKITFSTHLPYCGGMAPTEAMMNQYVPYAETVNLIDLSDDSKTICTPNAEGVLTLKLPIGNYAIQELYKDVPFSEFISENVARGTYIESGTDACYVKWWKSYIVKFDVTEEAATFDIKGNLAQRCFVGIDPCSYYNGPKPP